MAEVHFRQATRVYPGNDEPAVDAFDLDIAAGEFVVLVGPSGSGKTTALRMLAGLEEVDAGAIYIGERDVTYLAPKDRDVAMVFQNYALYPYLTVAANIGFPLSRGREEGRAGASGARGRGVARTDRLPRPEAGAAFRRPASAGGDGARNRPRAARLPDGRAALEPRREAARADARRHRRAAVAARRHHRLRHTRPGRGDDAGPPRRRPQGRPAPAVRRAAGAVRAAGQHVRRRVHRLAVDEPARGAAERRGCSFCGVQVPLPASLPASNGKLVLGLRRNRSSSPRAGSRLASRWSRRSARTHTSSVPPTTAASRSSWSRAARPGRHPSARRRCRSVPAWRRRTSSTPRRACAWRSPGRAA